MHHGVVGMHWGVRRYQNKDGSLTDEGRKHISKLSSKQDKISNKIHTLEVKQAKLNKKTDKYYRKELTGKMTMNQVNDATRSTRKKMYKIDTKIEKLLRQHDAMTKKISDLDPTEAAKAKKKSIALLNEIGYRNTANYKLVKTIREYGDDYA